MFVFHQKKYFLFVKGERMSPCVPFRLKALKPTTKMQLHEFLRFRVFQIDKENSLYIFGETFHY